MLGGRKRIRDGYSLPRKALLQVFGQKKAASSFRGRRENHGIPDTERMNS